MPFLVLLSRISITLTSARDIAFTDASTAVFRRAKQISPYLVRRKMDISNTDKVQYDRPVDPELYAWYAVREYERLHPKSLRQRLGATTRDAWASCLQTSTSG